MAGRYDPVERADEAGGVDPAAGRGAGDQAASQRQGTDRAVPVPRRPQSQPEHRSGGERVALQGRVRRGRRRNPLGGAVRGSERCARHRSC